MKKNMDFAVKHGTLVIGSLEYRQSLASNICVNFYCDLLVAVASGYRMAKKASNIIENL